MLQPEIFPELSLQIELSNFSSSDVSDALARLTPDMAYIPAISLMSPLDQTTRICGPAYTAEFALLDHPAPPIQIHHLDSAPSGSVVVYKVPREAPNAVWGGLMTTRAIHLGVVGVVVEGYIRDLNEHREIAFPVFASGTSTLSASKFVKVISVEEPIVLGGSLDYQILIKNGDYIVADIDGVVRVPRELIEQVISICKTISLVDEKCKHDLKNGISIRETFTKHRG